MTRAAAQVARAAAVAPPERAIAGWMVGSFDGVRLALPQREVRLIELLGDLKRPTDDTGPECGWLAHADGAAWPAYSLDAAMRLQTRMPETRRVCVFFAAGDAVLGLACDRIVSLAADADLAAEPLPGCMRTQGSPLAGIARYADGIAAVVAASELATYINGLRGVARGAHE